MNPLVALAISTCTILALAMLSLLSSYNGGSGWRNRKFALKKLIKEAARSVATADQDTAPTLAFLHTTMAKGYLNSARALASDSVIQKTCGVHAPELLKLIDDKQENCIATLNRTCPAVKVDSEALRSTGWLL